MHNILAQTIGALPSENQVVKPRGEGWLERLNRRLSPIFAPVVTPRFAMSFGMAFFSITMLLSIAGFHASDLRHVDLSSKGVVKAYYTAQARVVRYYENIRLVYEIESRVRDLRRVATPAEKQEAPAPKAQPKSENNQDNERRNQNYNRGDGSQPVLAASPAVKDQVIQDVKYQAIPQARLEQENRHELRQSCRCSRHRILPYVWKATVHQLRARASVTLSTARKCLASHLSGVMPPPGNVAVPPGVQPPVAAACPQ